MEITQPLGNAGYHKHDKNMQIQASPQPLPQNQGFSSLSAQQQKQGHIGLSSIGLSEFNSQFYQIKSNFLVGSNVSELARAKLRAWIYEETARLNVSRHLCGYACTYVDLYLSKDKEIKLEQFQILGMACLLLANKLTDNVEMKVDYSSFPKKEIKYWEGKVCIVLQFRLNPLTYHTILGWLVAAWNKFAEEHGLWIYNTNEKSSDVTTMFEVLDFLALSSKSVRYSNGVLQLQVFKIVNRINFEKIKEKQSLSIQDEVLISFWSNPEQENILKSSFQTISRKFECFAKTIQPWINKITLEERKQAQNWVNAILSEKSQLVNQSGKTNSNVWLQTSNSNWYNQMKKISKSQKTNNHRKSSIQTTI